MLCSSPWSSTSKFLNINQLCCCLSLRSVHEIKAFSPKKVVILYKTSRYEYEKKRQSNLSESALKSYLSSKGSDFDGLLERHNQHHKRLDNLKHSLIERDIEVQLVDRFSYSEDVINWSDAVFSAGGDGTFLLAASKIVNNHKPLIGVNTDPERSEGYLCLPKRCSDRIPSALDILLKGKFSWQWRQRIRITTSGKHGNDDPVEIHQLQLCPEYRFIEHVKEHEECSNVAQVAESFPDRVLPVRALNEVFIGESLSARASYYEMAVDDNSSIKQKSSGVTVCTGTGSFSWHYHINDLSTDCIGQVLSIAHRHCLNISTCNLPFQDLDFLQRVSDTHQRSLTFNAHETRMAFTVRDPIKNSKSQQILL